MRTVVAMMTMALGAACAKPAPSISPAPEATIVADNPLLAPWTGPYGGVPAFDAVKVEDGPAAIETAMADMLSEIDAITANPDPATFDNTIVALERTGQRLDRVMTYWHLWRSNNSTPLQRELHAEIAPRLAAFWTGINQNEALFDRILAVHDGDEMDQLLPAQQRLVKLTHDGFARRGATLDPDDKARYAELTQRLAELYTRFGDNVLADEGRVTYLDATQLSGLPSSYVKAAAAAAEARDNPDGYAVTNTRSSVAPFLTYSEARDLRERVWRTYYDRGDNGDEHDNNAIIAEILQLRHERAGLLGYDSYAAWRLEDRMAKTPERAMELMEGVWPAAIDRAAEEVAAMQAIADDDGITIAPWDYRFYAEKVRKDRYDLNSDEVKQYLQLDNLREGMFFVAGKLFGFSFSPLAEDAVPVFHADVRVWEVRDQEDQIVGLWYLDPFAREGKRSGAWATTYRSRDAVDGPLPILSANNSNFVAPAPGEPVLISWDDAQTLFHEFGHALHYLSSNAPYPSLNGGVRDYTEFQSQLLERWLLTDEVIDPYLLHVDTGEPMPPDLVARIRSAANFNQGFATTEYLASALIDMKLHTADPTDLDPDAFERETLEELGMPSEIVMRHRTPHFGHVFSGEGYAAGYYGYLWADVLTADAAEAFAEAPGGYYDTDVASLLVEHLFAVQNAVDPADAYRAFRGRDADVSALMRDRGFEVPEE